MTDELTTTFCLLWKANLHQKLWNKLNNSETKTDTKKLQAIKKLIPNLDNKLKSLSKSVMHQIKFAEEFEQNILSIVGV